MKFALPLLALLAASQLACQAANVIEPAMVTIPAGEFMMGTDVAPAGDGKHNPLEAPVHKVQLKTFRLAKYTITVRQFREFVAATGYKMGNNCWKWTRPAADDPDGYLTMAPGNWKTAAYAPSDFHPVMCVSWDDAQAYAAWLSKHTGRHFRLPSEAEWEYAARAGTQTRYPSGDDPATLCQYANVRDETGNAAFTREYGVQWKPIACNDGAEFTTVVGSYRPNPWGLYDMIGNVGQWTAHCEHPDYQGAPTDGSAWTKACSSGMGPGEPMYITRGGSYANGPVALRPTTRAHGGQSNRSSLGEGFRLAEDGSGEDCGAKGCKVSPATQAFLRELAKAQEGEQQRRRNAAQKS
ncbi:formylglycine-generating enzyme family protein [Chitinimonas sp.]|uniref:formylglycine-generating enzyme family protein n=1 Tax=Chitinimonas sp. TaxID=1934313 RepID=UPI002F953AC2